MLNEASRRHYAKLYARPGAMHAGFAQFAAFDQDAVDNRAFVAAGKLDVPVLALGGEKSFGTTMAAVMRFAASDVDEGVVPDSGHWIMEGYRRRRGKLIIRRMGGLSKHGPGANIQWPKPKELPSGLLPVAPFQTDFLPTTIGPWVEDIAERMQCPPDFVGVSATAALGAMVGNKIGIHPMRRNDWFEVPNLWALIVGRPGILKSPSMQQALAMTIVKTRPQRGAFT